MIWFNSEKSRTHLIKNGNVVTARKDRKTFGYDKAVFRNEKGERVYLFMVDIAHLEDSYEGVLNGESDERNMYHKRILSKYVHHSGFENVNEWVREICKLNNNRKIPAFLRLLWVVKI